MLSIKRKNVKTRSQGLTLVETMIAITVIAFILGGSLIPLSTYLRFDAYDNEKQQIQSFHDAILGYLIRNQTIAREVIVSDGVEDFDFRLPAGRPYLPCPDVDGDGHEDRSAYDALGLTSNTSGLLLTINYGLLTPQNDILAFGNCATTRGILPWKTLGIQPRDQWGSRYTFAVDDVFSNAVTGFDESAIPDEFDIRLPAVVLNGEFQYGKRGSQGFNTNQITSGGGDIIYTNNRRPILVCDGLEDLCLRQVSEDLILDAGKAAIQTDPIVAPRKTFIRGDVLEGLPYVIVSHGLNGYGAVRHDVNIGNTLPQVNCNSPVTNDGLANAASIVVEPYQVYEATNFPFVEEVTTGANRYCNPIRFSGNNLQNNYFFNLPQVNNPANGRVFDDIIIWQTRQNLLRQLKNYGLLSAEQFPLLGTFRS